MTEYKLEFAFRDQSPSFAYGFICGQIRQQMKDRTYTFTMTVPAEIREDVIALATHYGWKEQIIEIDSGWLEVEFLREGKAEQQPWG